MESWRSTVLGVIPAVAGLTLVTIGALKGDTTMIVTGVGLLGGAGVAAVAKDQAAHEAGAKKNSG